MGNAMAKKVDNHNPVAKLALRRHFLRRYHSNGEIRVLDCCQGSARLWTQLRTEFPIATYWGVDLKRKAGRLQIDSQRILNQPGWRENVIDIDTYGSPWKHWFALLQHCDHDATVFLTVGHVALGGVDKTLLTALGLGALEVPAGIAVKLVTLGSAYCIGKCSESGFGVAEVAEVENPSGSARYIGVRLVKNVP